MVFIIVNVLLVDIDKMINLEIYLRDEYVKDWVYLNRNRVVIFIYNVVLI